MRTSRRIALALPLALLAGALSVEGFRAARDPSAGGTRRAARADGEARRAPGGSGAVEGGRSASPPPRLAIDRRAAGGAVASAADAAPGAGEAGGAGRLELLLVGAPGEALVRPVAFDPGGPRAVWLWREREGRSAVVARSHSGPDGAVVFPPLMVPLDGLVLRAAPARSGPEGAEVSAARRVEARAPPVPWVTPLGTDGEARVVRVTAGHGGGAIVVADASGAAFARFALPGDPRAAARTLVLDLFPEPGESRVLVAQELSDGRRSPWRPVQLEPTTTPEGEQ